MKRHYCYGLYLLKHKYYVWQAGRQLGVPVWRLLLHDWDKFLPYVWWCYANTFYAPNGQKRYAPVKGFFEVRDRHTAKNKHHWQHWAGKLIPEIHVREMLADWYGAGHAHSEPDVANWYKNHKTTMTLHLKTREQVEKLLGV